MPRENETTTPAASAEPTNATIPEATPPTPAPPADEVSMADLARGLNRMADVLSERLPARAAAPAAAQTDLQALDGAEAVLRERVASEGLSTEAVVKIQELEAQRDAANRALEEMRRTSDFRSSSYSTGEAMERIGEHAQVLRSETMDFWRGLDTRHQSREAWSDFCEGMTPIEVLLRGALEQRTIDIEYSEGRRFSVQGMGALTAGATDPVLREAQEQMDAMFYWVCVRRAPTPGGGAGQGFMSLRECPFYSRYERAMTNLAHALPLGSQAERAMTASSLSNWVPTGFSARVIERFELARNLSRFLPFYQMTQNPEQRPRRGGYLTPYKHTASTSNPEDITPKITTTDMSPGQLLLNLHNFVFRVVFSIDAEEDTIPSLVPNLIDDLGRSWAYSLESAVQNSSDAVIPVPGHIDVDVTSSASYLNTWQGLRPAAIANAYTTSLATFTGETVISNMHSAMGKYSANPLDLIAVVGPKVKAILKLLKNSGNHPLVTGSASPSTPSRTETGVQMLELDGSPMVVSESARENLNASGFYDGTTENLGQLMWVNVRGWVLAARNIAGRTFPDFNTQTAQHELLVHHRMEFEDELDVSTEQTVQLGVNIALS